MEQFIPLKGVASINSRRCFSNIMTNRWNFVSIIEFVANGIYGMIFQEKALERIESERKTHVMRRRKMKATGEWRE